ncbi:MAG: hypothetical protein JNM56_08535 [Planctomycetia bacterium]|nr:hypothetical protein [Planctomycetia bacterium]
MTSSLALLGLSLLAALSVAQPENPGTAPRQKRQYQVHCQVILHQPNGKQQLVMEPTLCVADGRPAEYHSGGSTGDGKHFGTYFTCLVRCIDPTQVHLEAEAEWSKHIGGGKVETIVRFRCDQVVQPGTPIQFKQKDAKKPNQFYLATFWLQEMQ